MNRFSSFFEKDSAPGILLMLSAVVAILIANTPLARYYDMLIDVPFIIGIGELEISKPLLLWINDGLMAIFFMLVGLELKREFLEGELSDRSNIILPGIGAIGGMFIPAGIYVLFNYSNPNTIDGWAIPAATDIAFALGIVSLLGSRVPTSLKVFLTSLAIFDDLGAIIIIALFYTSKISQLALGVAFTCIVVLFLLNRFGVMRKRFYLAVGAIMWVAVLKSGVHATFAGVTLALFIPVAKDNNGVSPLKSLEHDLHPIVYLFVLPVFAFANSGIALLGLSIDQVLHSVPIGIALGLFIGKQIGIFGLCFLAIKLGIAKLPSGMNLKALYGTAALCGVGFTMSLFIGSLAFEETGINMIFDERLGILIGSVASGLVGYLVLKHNYKDNTNA